MAQDTHIFFEYCKTGNIDNIKNMSLNKCDLNGGFRKACYNGHYMIVKYLVELYKTGNPNYNMIDIHSCDGAGFIWVCYYGHYIIVKYLMTLYKKHKNIYKPINNYLIIFNKFHKYEL